MVLLLAYVGQEVVLYHSGDQYEVKNFRPVKNTFIQQRSGRMEHEITVSDYKRCSFQICSLLSCRLTRIPMSRHCELAKKIVGFDSINDFKVKNPSVVYRNYFRRTNGGMFCSYGG